MYARTVSGAKVAITMYAPMLAAVHGDDTEEGEDLAHGPNNDEDAGDDHFTEAPCWPLYSYEYSSR